MVVSKSSRSSKERKGPRKSSKKKKISTERPIIIIMASPESLKDLSLTPSNSSTSSKPKKSKKEKVKKVAKTTAALGAGAGVLSLLSPVIAGYTLHRSKKRYKKRKEYDKPPHRKRLMPYKAPAIISGTTSISPQPTYRDIHGYRNR